MSEPQRCPQCGTELAPGVAEGLCPRCLMMAGIPTDVPASQIETIDAAAGAGASGTGGSGAGGSGAGGSGAGGSGGSGAGGPGGAGHHLPRPGERFGEYRIVRVLGQGGMGAVYEADDEQSGRRVALKVLSHALDSPEARKRFLREGRLAASINHPNSVYVFGTEEIQNTPAISMELVSGGTLQERVQQHGAMPVGEAVDAILQIIAGLEAAQALGVLHRDIKPSNCFIDSDGTVKIGDFGLSISTEPRGQTQVTISGAFLGTPAFSPPEQLRGDELNLRSDMYAVGVTLFYLLTGKTPFHGRNVVQLLATVLEQPAPSPSEVNPNVPKALGRIVQRLLAKQPTDRFRDYEELRHALAPFSSEAPTPAPLGMRFVAGALDMLAITLVLGPIQLAWFGSIEAMTDLHALQSGPPLVLLAIMMILLMSYWGVLEGVWGATLGKAICRLRVVGAEQRPIGLLRGFGRALLFCTPPLLPSWIFWAVAGPHYDPSTWQWPAILIGYTPYAILAAEFSTARRRNGFAAIHDLLTHSHVIRRARLARRPLLAAPIEPLPDTQTLPMIGPYYVLDTLAQHNGDRIVLGYDTRLLRRVWVRWQPNGAAPVGHEARNVGRPGRLRWLNGRRTESQCWDAYEAPTGKPLMALINQRQPWRIVRYWLLDLAEEFAAAERHGSLPDAVALDRVWITADSRAKLLDFTAPGVEPAEAPLELPADPAARQARVNTFICQIAYSAVEGRPVTADEAHNRSVCVPLPLHARDVLDELAIYDSIDEVVQALRPLVHRVASVTRLRRAGLVFGCGAGPLVLATFSALAFALVFVPWTKKYPNIQPLQQTLIRIDWLDNGRFKPPADSSNYRDALEVYVAGRFGDTIRDPQQWKSLFATSTITPNYRAMAERIVAQRGSPTPQELAEAEEQLKDFINETKQVAQWTEKIPIGSMVAIMAITCLLIYVMIPALLCALAFRGGLVMLLLGVTVVRNDGRRASRGRTFLRSLIAWLPWLTMPFMLALLTPRIPIAWSFALLVVLAAGLTAWSVVRPTRSLQDTIARTWLVPR